MPGPPPRQHKHERQYTPSTHSVIPTRRIWNDDDGQMIFGDLVGLKLPDICLTGEEKPRKNLTQETCPDRGSNPGPLWWTQTINNHNLNKYTVCTLGKLGSQRLLSASPRSSVSFTSVTDQFYSLPTENWMVRLKKFSLQKLLFVTLRPTFVILSN